MVTVYIRNYRGKNQAWGHAAMQVDNTYMSWWPETPNQVPSKIHNSIYASNPHRNRTYSEDFRAEGCLPNHTIRINGLDEGSIKIWWRSFGLTYDHLGPVISIYVGPLLPWETLKRNCSTVVATGLIKGGGSHFASWGKAWNVIWTPQDVYNYALSIQKNLTH